MGYKVEHFAELSKHDDIICVPLIDVFERLQIQDTYQDWCDYIFTRYDLVVGVDYVYYENDTYFICIFTLYELARFSMDFYKVLIEIEFMLFDVLDHFIKNKKNIKNNVFKKHKLYVDMIK